jgi:5-methylcytosine-specific restriction endonuclease McrA
MQRPCLDCGTLIAQGSRCSRCAWKANPSERLRGRAWMRKRAAVMRRAGGICERCGNRLCEEIHHLGPLTDNRLESLLAVCRGCHKALEAEKREAAG